MMLNNILKGTMCEIQRLNSSEQMRTTDSNRMRTRSNLDVVIFQLIVSISDPFTVTYLHLHELNAKPTYLTLSFNSNSVNISATAETAIIYQ